MWIDAICIDQSNINERNHQVCLMRHIFTDAAQVTVWLGEATPTLLRAIEAIRILASDDTIHWDQRLSPNFGPSLLGDEGIETIKSFMQLCWWHRLWTVQEAVLAKSLMFICGQETISGTTVFKLKFNFAKHRDTCCEAVRRTGGGQPVFMAAQLWSGLSTLIWHTQRRGEVSLADAISDFRIRSCLDPRDKIYGIIGLGMGADQDILFPDYSKTAREVFEEAVLQLVNRSGVLDIIAYAEITNNGLPDMPSWVPDWTVELDRTTLMKLTSRLGRASWRSIYNACGSSKGALSSICLGKAMTAGVLVDQIRETSQESVKGIYTDANISTLKQWHGLAQSCASPGVDFMNPTTSCSDEFWITLVNGLLRIENLEPEPDVTFRRIGMPGDRDLFITWWTELSSKPFVGFGSRPIADFNEAVATSTTSKRFFVTENGYMATGPLATCAGDLVVVLPGGRMPFVLRRAGVYEHPEGATLPQYEVIGTAFAHGLMGWGGHGDGYGREASTERVSSDVNRVLTLFTI